MRMIFLLLLIANTVPYVKGAPVKESDANNKTRTIYISSSDALAIDLLSQSLASEQQVLLRISEDLHATSSEYVKANPTTGDAIAIIFLTNYVQSLRLASTFLSHLDNELLVGFNRDWGTEYDISKLPDIIGTQIAPAQTATQLLFVREGLLMVAVFLALTDPVGLTVATETKSAMLKDLSIRAQLTRKHLAKQIAGRNENLSKLAKQYIPDYYDVIVSSEESKDKLNIAINAILK